MTPLEIKNLIEKNVPHATAHVQDPMNDGQHLRALVISSTFEGQPVFKQHRLVMNAVENIFQTVHALELKTFTPQQWEKTKDQYVDRPTP